MLGKQAPGMGMFELMLEVMQISQTAMIVMLVVHGGHRAEPRILFEIMGKIVIGNIPGLPVIPLLAHAPFPVGDGLHQGCSIGLILSLILRV